MKKNVNGHFLFWLKKALRPCRRFFVTPARISSRFLFPRPPLLLARDTNELRHSSLNTEVQKQKGSHWVAPKKLDLHKRHSEVTTKYFRSGKCYTWFFENRATKKYQSLSLIGNLMALLNGKSHLKKKFLNAPAPSRHKVLS